jgi:hypothetical protein
MPDMRGGNIAGEKSTRLRNPTTFASRRLLQRQASNQLFVTSRDLNCFDLRGTRPFNRFRMHSHTQSTNGPLQVFMNVRLSLSDKRLSRLNSGRSLCTSLTIHLVSSTWSPRRLLYFWEIGVLPWIVGEYFRADPIPVVGVGSQIDQ